MEYGMYHLLRRFYKNHLKKESIIWGENMILDCFQMEKSTKVELLEKMMLEYEEKLKDDLKVKVEQSTYLEHVNVYLTYSFHANIQIFVITRRTIDNLRFVPIVEPFPSRHAVQFARIRSLHIRNPPKTILLAKYHLFFQQN